MKTDNIIVDKSFDFAVRIVNLYKHMKNTKNEYVLSKQILRSGTSVGANINEAICGISKKDFLSKMYIAYKEILETIYWIKLLYKTDYLDQKQFESLHKDVTELITILTSICKTSQEKIQNNNE
jgi:four helix bundle protein